MTMIRETIHEFCVVCEYPDMKFCMAKFMHEEDAREYLGTKEDKEYVKWKLYKRLGSSYDEARWEPLGE
jgi:hypothetical protein